MVSSISRLIRDRDGCTADPEAVCANRHFARRGRHLSAPVAVSLAGGYVLAVRSGTAYLSKSVALWPCTTYVCLHLGDQELLLPVSEARSALAVLVKLVDSGLNL